MVKKCSLAEKYIKTHRELILEFTHFYNITKQKVVKDSQKLE